MLSSSWARLSNPLPVHMHLKMSIVGGLIHFCGIFCLASFKTIGVKT